MKSLEELHEYLFFQDRKCFKELMEHSENIMKLLSAESIARKCSKSMDRDDILYSLSLFLDLFQLLVSKRTKNLCPSLCNFCQLLCKQRCISQMLVTCLGAEDHFIAFQAHKIFREMSRVFSEIILNGPLQELILNCLREKKGTLVVLYTIEVIKDLLNVEAGLAFDSKQDKLQGFSSNCDCTLNEANLFTVNVDVKAVWDILLQYWPALSQLCVDNSFLISDINETVSPNRQSGKAVLQQPLASFVSLGSILVQLCHHPTVNGSSQPEHAKVKFAENVNATQFHSNKENCIETQNNIGKKIKLSGHEFVLSIFKSLQEAVEKLVEIDKQEFLLHLRRTVVQFFNDVVSISFQNSLAFSQRNFDHDALDHLASICSFLLVNACKLFRDIPRVSCGVFFGGQNFQNKEQLGSLVYDRVMMRKVVLLVLKSVLITLQVQKKSKSSNWKLLTDSLESWLNFVAKAMPEFYEGRSHDDDTANMVADSVIFLFADQDDELMTVLQYILKLYQQLFFDEGSLPATQWSQQLRRYLNPHLFFLEFLHSIHYDHSLLLDFLISNETCFLAYFSSYLRHMANDWDGFVGIAKELNSSRAMNLQRTDPGHRKPTKKNRNSKSANISTCRNALREKHFTNKCVALQDLREKHSNDISFLDSESGMEWSSGNDFKETKAVEVSIFKNSALLSIMDDYGGLSSDDSQDDENDWNETENENDQVCNYQENCDNQDPDEDHDQHCNNPDEDHDQHCNNHDEDDDQHCNNPDEDHDQHCNNPDEDHDQHCNNPDEDDDQHCNNPDEDHDQHCNNPDEDHDQHCNNPDEDHDQHCNNHDEDDDQHCNRHNHDEDHTQASDDDDADDAKVNYLRNSLACLIRLRFLIERMASKQLFPYPVEALVRLIRYIESLYEGN